MTVKQDNRPVLRPLLVAMGLLGLCCASLWGGAYFRDLQEREGVRLRAQRQQLAQKIANAQEDAKNISVYYPRFLEYKSQGIIGEEDRILWVETLSRLVQKREMIRMNYSIVPPQVFSTRESLKDADLYVSTMTVEMGLLHEGELLKLLELMKKEAKGLFGVSECSLKRKGAKLETSGTVANLEGRCVLLWYHVKSRSGQWEKAS